MPSTTDESKLFLSHAEIKIDGQSIPELMDKMRDITVEMTLNMPSMAVLRVHDEQLEWVDDSRLAAGKAIEISFGKQGETSPKKLFKGEIVSLEPRFTDMGAIMVIRAYDKLHRLGRGTYSKAFLNMKASDVVKSVASEHGLSANVDATTVVYESLIVDNETPLAYLRRWADHLGWIMWVDSDEKFNFKKTKNLGSVEAEWGADMTTFRPRLSAAAQATKIKVSGWDVKTKREYVTTVGSSRFENKIGESKAPNTLAQTAFGSEKQALVLNQYTTSQSEADSAAQAELDDQVYAGLEAEGTLFGNPDLLPGKLVNVTKVGTRFSGKYLVTSATHIYSGESGYMTEWRSEGRTPRTIADLVTSDGLASGGSGRTGRWYGLYPAIVTDNNDPENLFRVKVKFPWWDDTLNTFWIRVVNSGGGANRGLVNLPEVNDEVLVGFEDGHMDRGYVLGGLYNGKDKPKNQSSALVNGGKVVLREWCSRAGHRITISDKSGEEYIEITDTSGKFQMKLDITAKKTTIVNEQKKVEMESGKILVESDSNVEVKAQGNIKISGMGNVDVEATGNLSLKANGQVTVKGAVVNIN
jgi:phage protein D/phage baseplate assembly protein gpV